MQMCQMVFTGETIIRGHSKLLMLDPVNACLVSDFQIAELQSGIQLKGTMNLISYQTFMRPVSWKEITLTLQLPLVYTSVLAVHTLGKNSFLH